MEQVLPPDLTFPALCQRLADLGWRDQAIPGLLPPLVPHEPETAAFTRGGERLDYRFHPAFALRVLAGPVPAGLPALDPAELPALIRSADPATALLGAEAAVALGQGALRRQILLRAMWLPRDLAPQALSAAHRLAPLCAEARGFAALPPARQHACLRLALKHRSADAADLALVALFAGPDLAVTAMIAAARLGLDDLLPAFPRQASGEIAVAVRKLASATLRGDRPGADPSARNRFWRALLGQGDPDMDLRLAPFVEPPPDRVPAVLRGGLRFSRIDAVPHWLGDPSVAGSARRFVPRPFLIAETPVATCGAHEVLDRLATLGATHGLPLRLPTADELGCALRGTDGRLHPEPGARRRDWQSPWGLRPGPAGQEFCALGHMIHRCPSETPLGTTPASLKQDAIDLRPVIADA